MSWSQYAGIALAAFTSSSIFVFGLRAWAERKKFFDIPNERSSHKYPVPRGGGLAIVTCTIFGMWLIYPLIRIDVNTIALLAFTLAALFISIVSWIDDIHSLPNRIRFAAHSLGAIIIMIVFGYYKSITFPLIGEFQLGWLGPVLTFVWIVGLTNAYNFMDGIDGIAGGQAVVAGIGWFILAITIGDQLSGVISLLIMFSSLGFLLHNWTPAKIFMGDVGSAFLGFTFASIPLIVDSINPILPIMGGLMVWPFVFDSSYTFLRRLWNRENVFSAHRSHLYQRLVIAGLPHYRVTIFYSLLAILGLLTSYTMIQGRNALTIICFCLILLSIITLINTTIRYERFLDNPATPIL